MDNRLFEEKDWNYYTTVIPIMLFVIIFLLWAAFTKIDETIKGTGKVVPSGQTKVIQNLEGGIVSAILVNEGDNVKKVTLFTTFQMHFLVLIQLQKR
jgi:HlyD family secretion protein/adhesin transport system membrane fusion protein